MEEEKLRRINELAKKARESGLTPEETEEQQALRAAYIAAFRNNLTATLESTYIMDEHGNKRKLQRKRERGGT